MHGDLNGSPIFFSKETKMKRSGRPLVINGYLLITIGIVSAWAGETPEAVVMEAAAMVGNLAFILTGIVLTSVGWAIRDWGNQ